MEEGRRGATSQEVGSPLLECATSQEGRTSLLAHMLQNWMPTQAQSTNQIRNLLSLTAT
jgi:hypothetical protein